MLPQLEATEILADVVAKLMSSRRDIIVIMRKCQHVCELLQWEPDKSWFHQELNGYPKDGSLPPYRQVAAQRHWEPEPTSLDWVHWDTAKTVGALSAEDTHVEVLTLPVRDDLDWLLRAAEGGYRNPTGENRETTADSRRMVLHQVDVAPAHRFSAIVYKIENQALDFASGAYAQLRYGNALGDIWSEYRKVVDAGLVRLNFGKHLEVIEAGLTSDNPEAWRAAIFQCRSLFEDLARYLWQDNRRTYVYLPGTGPESKLEVTEDKYKNRLSAYLHQKGLFSGNKAFIVDEMDRLATSVSTLISLQSKAHRQIGKQDARSIAISTYIILGEFVNRTDLQPVTEYAEPVKGVELAPDEQE